MVLKMLLGTPVDIIPTSQPVVRLSHLACLPNIFTSLLQIESVALVIFFPSLLQIDSAAFVIS
jgi:hypothetical protein